MSTYTTALMTPRQADDFIAAFDAEIGTETETTDDGEGQQSVTCFELTPGEVLKSARIFRRVTTAKAEVL